MEFNALKWKSAERLIAAKATNVLNLWNYVIKKKTTHTKAFSSY